jgi:hypothetical protein
MYVKPGSDTYLTLCFRYKFAWNISKPNCFKYHSSQTVKCSVNYVSFIQHFINHCTRLENIPPWHFISVNRKIKYTILTPHNFAKVDFTIKWNIVSLQIDAMTFKINANKIIWFWNILRSNKLRPHQLVRAALISSSLISLSSSFKF